MRRECLKKTNLINFWHSVCVCVENNHVINEIEEVGNLKDLRKMMTNKFLVGLKIATRENHLSKLNESKSNLGWLQIPLMGGDSKFRRETI